MNVLDTPLTNFSPHYSNPAFNKEQTIYGQAEEGLNYDYSDRLVQWDYDKAKESQEYAYEQVKTESRVPTVRWVQVYLSKYHDADIEIVHIIAGVNKGNGYPYQVFGYRTLQQGLQNESNKEAKKKTAGGF